MSHVTGKRPISLWNAFLASRVRMPLASAPCPFVEEHSCQLPRLLVSCGQVLAMDKVLATEYVRFNIHIYLRKLTS
jgi:hypothetical protein